VENVDGRNLLLSIPHAHGLFGMHDATGVRAEMARSSFYRSKREGVQGYGIRQEEKTLIFEIKHTIFFRFMDR
jgi:hypothetical protein